MDRSRWVAANNMQERRGVGSIIARALKAGAGKNAAPPGVSVRFNIRIYIEENTNPFNSYRCRVLRQGGRNFL